MCIRDSLAQEQMDKKLKEGIPGEYLNLLIGSIPYNAGIKKVTASRQRKSQCRCYKYSVYYTFHFFRI